MAAGKVRTSRGGATPSPFPLPEGEETLSRLLDVLGHEPAGLATDFDGTVSAIVSPPEAAVPLPGAEEALRRLVDCLEAVAIVSGRSVPDLTRRIRVPGATYVGLHGLEWWRADGSADAPIQLSVAPTAAESARLAAASAALHRAFDGEPGLRIEEKGPGVAVHYRDAADPLEMRSRVLAVCEPLAEAADGDGALALREGKLVAELGLARGTNKGATLRRLAEERGLRSLVFLGDDLTDVDGFRALPGLREAGVAALGVAVATPDAPAAVREWADLALPSPGAAVELLGGLAARLRDC